MCALSKSGQIVFESAWIVDTFELTYKRFKYFFTTN